MLSHLSFGVTAIATCLLMSGCGNSGRRGGAVGGGESDRDAGPTPEHSPGPVDATSDIGPADEDSGARDAGTVDASDPVDIGPPVQAGCDDWPQAEDPEPAMALHRALAASYRPVTPEMDLGGTLNRYTTSRALMFKEVERMPHEASGRVGVEGVYTGLFVATEVGEEPDDDIINAEHVWPRSRMDEDRESTLYFHHQSDIHNLYPSDPEANSARGSLRYGEPVSDRVLDHSPSVIGTDRAGERVFEPRAERRGDLARAIFYFSVRWGLAIQDAEEAVLRRWHEQDPADERERRRNDVIEPLQGNRNPFVDCAALVALVADFEDFETVDRDLPNP